MRKGLIFGLIAVGVSGWIVLGSFWLLSKDTQHLGYSPTPVPGVGEAMEPMADRSHFPETMAITDVIATGYGSMPPASGPHWSRWAPCVFSRQPIPDEAIVHNLEHGNLVLSYNLEFGAPVDQLEEAWNAIPATAEWGIARIHNQLPAGTIAVTAWGVIDQWSIDTNIDKARIDKARITRFFDTYAGKLGPEFPNGAPCTEGATTQ